MVPAFIPSPDQGTWQIGFFELRAYALCIIVGVLVAVWLGPVLALPEAESRPLLDTLRAWVAHGGSTTHTAEAVPCHRNTVLNRLHRVAELTGQDAFDGAPPLELALALRALASGSVR